MMFHVKRKCPIIVAARKNQTTPSSSYRGNQSPIPLSPTKIVFQKREGRAHPFVGPWMVVWGSRGQAAPVSTELRR